MVCRTLAVVSGEMDRLPVRTSDTVLADTPAAGATSLIVATGEQRDVTSVLLVVDVCASNVEAPRRAVDQIA